MEDQADRERDEETTAYNEQWAIAAANYEAEVQRVKDLGRQVEDDRNAIAQHLVVTQPRSGTSLSIPKMPKIPLWYRKEFSSWSSLNPDLGLRYRAPRCQKFRFGIEKNSSFIVTLCR